MVLTMYNYGFREVTPDQTVNESWKEIKISTGGTHSTLQDVKLTERAGGYCYKDFSKHFTRNRFIYWRITNNAVELIEQSLDLNLLGNRVRYRFTDTTVLDGISIHELYDTVIILIPTVCSVHYFKFPHPFKIHKHHDVYTSHPDISVPSIFADKVVCQVANASNFHIINNILPNSSLPLLAATTLNPVNEEGLYFFAYASGSVVFRISDSSTGFIELKQDTMVPRFLSGLAGAFRGKISDGDTVLSVLFHTFDIDTCVIVLTKDGHIRLWNCSKGTYGGSTHVLNDLTEDDLSIYQGAQSHSIRKCTSSDSQNLIVGVFLCLTKKYEFHILNINYQSGQGAFENISTVYTPGQDLVDFTIEKKRLWAVWRDSTGNCNVSVSLLGQKVSAVWIPIVLEAPYHRDFIPPKTSVDPKQLYVDYIFYPGRFPTGVIVKALSIFRRSVILSDVTISQGLLKQRVCLAVDAEIQSETSDFKISDDEYLEIANRCWARFYSCCAQYYITEARPVGLLLLPPASGTVLLRKSSISILRPMDDLENLALCVDNINPEQFARDTLITNDSQLSHDLVELVSVLMQIEHSLTDSVKSDIEEELRCWHSPDDIIRETIKQLVTGQNDDCVFSPALIYELFRKVGQIRDLSAAIGLLLSLLGFNFDMNMDLEDSSVNRNLKIENLYTSLFGISTIAKSVHQMAELRFSICRNLLFLQRLPIEQSQLSAVLFASIVTQYLSTTVTYTLAYFSIVWICESATSQVSRAISEPREERLTSLNLSTRHSTFRLLSQRLHTLSEHYVLCGAGKRAHDFLQSDNLDEFKVPLWHYSLLKYVGAVLKVLWPVNNTSSLEEWLLTNEQHLLLHQYTTLLSTWCPSNKKAREFFLAVSFLETGERYKALDLFQKAAEGLSGEIMEPFFRDTLLRDVNKDSNALVQYYLKVINLFEEHRAFDSAIASAKIAICEARSDEPYLPTLYSAIFNHYLTLEQYQDAYDALISNPEEERKKHYLRVLVEKLLDKRYLDVLMSFPFTCMLNDFQKIVLARARAMNPEDNYIYDFLYAYYVNQGNWYTAAAVMYEQAYSLNRFSQLWAVEKQAKSYLACVNALSLIEDHHQFLTRPINYYFAGKKSDSEVKEIVKIHAPTRKDGISDTIRRELEERLLPSLSLDDITGEFDLKRVSEVVTIDEIRGEMELATARLHLAKLEPNVPVACPNPNEIVSQLTNVGLFDVAVNICKINKLPFEPVIEALTTICLRLQDSEHATSWSWLMENDVSEFFIRDRSPAAVSWSLLRSYLIKFEAEDSVQLHHVVAKRVINLGYYLPQWCMDTYKMRNAGDLIHLFYSCGRLKEAYELSIEYLSAAMGKGKEYFGLSHSILPTEHPVCLPIREFVRVLLALRQVKEKTPEYEEYHNELSRLLKMYGNICKRVSIDMFKNAYRSNLMEIVA